MLKTLIFYSISLLCSSSCWALSPFASKPILYYFTSPGCPACRMMDPIIDETEKRYQEKLQLIRFPGPSKQRLEIMRKFYSHVDLSYVPTMVLTNSENHILAFGKGFIRQSPFFQLLDEGLEKGKKLAGMKVSNLLFLCRTSLKACQETEEEIKAWLETTEKSPISYESIDFDQMKTPEDFQKFSKRLEKIRYLYGLEQIPALIGMTSKSEVISLIQNVFSLKDLEEEFKGHYKVVP